MRSPMTELAWQTCQNPAVMLEYLAGTASARKLRLFAVACCRQIWDVLADSQGQRVVLVAESYADGAATRKELGAAFRDAYAAIRRADQASRRTAAEQAAWATVWDLTFDAGTAANWASRVRGSAGAARNIQTGLLRCIFRGPCRPIVLAPAILAGQQGTVARMAESIYEGRQWEDMPLLGDALEKAGCADRAVLDHCRGPGPHGRGCFVVDLILSKDR